MTDAESSQRTDHCRERPIDRHPRVRDTGRWLMASGALQAVIGLGFVYQAWQGHQPGVSALMAFMMGAIAMGLFFDYKESDSNGE